MKFVLFEKLSELEGLELYMLIGALALVVIFAAAMLIFKLKPSPKSDRLGPVMSALLTAALAFVVSYLVMLYITEIRGAGMYVISGCAAFAVLVAFAAVDAGRREKERKKTPIPQAAEWTNAIRPFPAAFPTRVLTQQVPRDCLSAPAHPRRIMII